MAKKITKLAEKLSAECAHPDIWRNQGKNGYPNSELAYFRADYDGFRWWNTVWHINNDLYTKELGDEFDAVMDAFRRSFKDYDAMRKYCHAKAGRTGSYDEFNAYYEGATGYYWLRMITRRGDYNLYLHCYSKEAM